MAHPRHKTTEDDDMASTSGNVNGELKGTDYGDEVRREVAAGKYKYELGVGGDGKLALKVETRHLTTNGSNWVTVEKKSEVRGGANLDGYFDVEETTNGGGEIQFNFTREFLSKQVTYDLDYDKV
jgi:hypothetical protein